MNQERRFIAALLNAPVADQERFWASRPPLRVYSLQPNEAMWVYKHKERYGVFPSVELFKDRFQTELPRSREKIEAALEPILASNAFVEIKSIVQKTTEQFNSNEDPTKILSEFKAKAEKLISHASTFSDERMEDGRSAFERYRLERDVDPAQRSLLTSPWDNLTKILGGSIRPGEVVVIAARPFTGKSWILFEWVRHIAQVDRKNILLISKEMPVSQVSDRLTALRFRLPYLKFRNRELSLEDQVRWKLAVMRRDPFPVLISGEESFRGTTLEDVNGKVQKERPSVLAIDGAYLLSIDGIPAHKEREKFAAISQGAKRLAKANNIPVFLVLQMNREADNLNKKTGETESKGGLSTLYGADAWGQDADYVIEVRGKVGSKERELRVHKARDGGVGGALMHFDLDSAPNLRPKTVAELKVNLKPL